MINFFRRKTSSIKNPYFGGSLEHSTLTVQSACQSAESLHCIHQVHEPPEAASTTPYKKNEITARQNGHNENLVQLIKSPSLDDSQFIGYCTNRKGIYLKSNETTINRPLTEHVSAVSSIDISSNCDSHSPLNKSMSGSQIIPQPVSREETGVTGDYCSSITHSPKCYAKRMSSNRKFSHSQPASTNFVPDSSVPDRKVITSVMKADLEIMPRLYVKKREHNVFALQTVSGDNSLDDSTTESGLSGSHESQSSFSDDAISSPIAPPRKRRSRVTKLITNGSSGSPLLQQAPLQLAALPSSMINVSSKNIDLNHSETSLNQFQCVSNICDSLDFRLNPPPGFSNLDLDLLDAGSKSRNSVSHKITQHDVTSGSSVDQVLPPPDVSDAKWNDRVYSSGKKFMSCGIAMQPDVLIGTQRDCINSSLSSLPSDSNTSFDGVQETAREVNFCKNSNTTCHELTVFHQLHGPPSKSVLNVKDNSSSREVIDQILHLEKLIANPDLYRLCAKAVDPRMSRKSYVELDMTDCPLRHIKQKNRGGNICFELYQKQGKQIRVTYKAGLEIPQTVIFGISSENTCGNVLEIAVPKFGIMDASTCCLIQVDRNAKGYPMKRVKDSQVIAELPSDYFLLCESNYLANSSCAPNLSNESLRKVKSCAQPTNLPASSSTIQFGVLERKVSSLETKLTENERSYQQQLKKQKNLLDTYKAIAFCAAPSDKIALLEAELQKLTREMQYQEQQLQAVRDAYQRSGQVQGEMKKLDDKLTVMEESLSETTKEQMEMYSLLEKAKIQQKTSVMMTSMSNMTVPSLYSICHDSQGCCLYAYELDRSSVSGLELLSLKGNKLDLFSGQSNSSFEFLDGDRILEINGQSVYHLNEQELVALVNEITDNLHIVVLREESLTTDVYIL